MEKTWTPFHTAQEESGKVTLLNLQSGDTTLLNLQGGNMTLLNMGK